jgi:electron transfer flavoprotein beta subunit
VERVIVCIKPVTDPKEWHRLRLDPVTRTLIREGVPSVINPLDKHALEAALQIKDACGAEVVLLSMAPPFARSLLREALAMGADRALLLSDRVFAGSDTLATARILSAGIAGISAFDLVLCGNATLDGSTAQVPSQLAEFLGIPNVMHVCGLEMRGPDRFIITQRIEMGYVRMEAEPPLLLSFTKEVNKPRYISFSGILEAEKKDISLWANDRLGLEAAGIGLWGSPTKMADILLRQARREGKRLQGTPEEIAQEVADTIYRLGII